MAVFASVLAGLRLTATVHSAGPLSRADIEALDMAERVFGISGHTVRALREWDIHAELVYPSAAVSPSWRPGRALERDRSGVVVFVPELPVDSSVLVDAAHRVGGDARFWAAGDADERLREEVASTGLSRRIAFFGPTIPGEASLLTATSDIVFLPEMPAASDLPFPVVMAMEAGLPIVGPKARGLREVLSGHMFDDPSGKAAAEALAPLIADEGLRRRAGERNRRFAAENLGPGNVDKLRRAFMDPTGG